MSTIPTPKDAHQQQIAVELDKAHLENLRKVQTAVKPNEIKVKPVFVPKPHLTQRPFKDASLVAFRDQLSQQK